MTYKVNRKTQNKNLLHLHQYFEEEVSFVRIRTGLNHEFDVELCQILGFAGLLL